MGGRINTIMQTCFFAHLRRPAARRGDRADQETIEKTYGKKGEEVVQRNFAAVDQTLAHLDEVTVPGTGHRDAPAARRWSPTQAPDFVKRVTAVMLAGQGRPAAGLSAFPVDGTWPLGHGEVGEAEHRRRSAGLGPEGLHPVQQVRDGLPARGHPRQGLRARSSSTARPATFQSTDYQAAEFKGWKYTIQVAPEDCTGCNLCVMVCPAKDKSNPKHKAINMDAAGAGARDGTGQLRLLPAHPRSAARADRAHRRQELAVPARRSFEYSGACAGCGETPYLKLLTQLFGDRLLIANATGCSSIYGGNLPTTPYTTNRDGRGPAWSNSLFEDNAEFGLGLRLSIDNHAEQARRL